MGALYQNLKKRAPATHSTLCPIMYRQLSKYFPHPVSISVRERTRSAFGAFLGILSAGLIVHAMPLDIVSTALLIAPMGASSVLLFAVPGSPLAHPWSVVGGNTLAALVGVAAALLIVNPVIAAAVAVCVAILVMFALRCLHPPSGAVALTAVLGGPAVHQAGFWFALAPVALQSLTLVVLAIVYHRATGHRYPHVAKPAAPTPRAAVPAISREHIETVLAREHEFVDIDVDDLVRLFDGAVREARAGGKPSSGAGTLKPVATP